MSFLKKNKYIFAIILVSLVITIALLVFNGKYDNYSYFINLVCSIVFVMTIALKVFRKTEVKTVLVLLICNFSWIISANRLYLNSVLVETINDFSFLNWPIPFVVASVIIILIIRLLVWAFYESRIVNGNHFNNKPIKNINEKTKAGELDVDALHESKNNKLETNTNMKKGESVFNSGGGSETEQTSKNSPVYVIVVSLIAVTSIVATLLFLNIFKEQININNLDIKNIFYKLFVGISLAVVLVISLIILFKVSGILYHTMLYKKPSSHFQELMKKYATSIFLACMISVLYIIKYGSDITDLLNDKINEVLRIPIIVCVMLVVFLVMVWLIHFILQIFEISEDAATSKVKSVGEQIKKDIFGIAKNLYEIVIRTIKGIISFALIFPDYVETIKNLAIGSQIETNTTDVKNGEHSSLNK